MDEEGKEHPIAYDSRILNSTEQNYDTTHLEAYAIIWAIKKFRRYLHGKKFKIITDHQALKWILNSNTLTTKGKFVRWRMLLQEYDYEIIHKQGKSHNGPDALSRTVVPSHTSQQNNFQHE